jgi:hypothetical protein
VTTIEDAAEGFGFGAIISEEADERCDRHIGRRRCRWPLLPTASFWTSTGASCAPRLPPAFPVESAFAPFRGPLEVIRPEKGEPRKIGLMHPGLAEHPFVQHVEALGIEVAREGVANAYGYTERGKGHGSMPWILSAKACGRTDRDAALYRSGFDLSRRCLWVSALAPRKQGGQGLYHHWPSPPHHARMGPCEPDDRAAVIRQFCAQPVQDSGSEFWPINIGPGIVAEEQAWAVIHGIEDGWFAHDRAGFLQWTQLGRDRFTAGPATSYTEASGQAAFAF